MDFEILKTGKFINSNGAEVNFSQEDLTKIAASYNPSLSEAPMVIGHPQTNDPAYGWIDSLKVEGDKLIASASKIVPEFLTAIKDGLFKKRSISLTPDGYLRHVGFLGAVLPAVKGLADLQFEDVQAVIVFDMVFSELEPKPVPVEEFHLSDVLLQISNLSEEINKFKNDFSEWKELRVSVTKDDNNAKPDLNVTYTFSSNFKDQIEQAFQDGKLTVPMKEKLLSLLSTNFSDDNFSLENFLSGFVSSFPVIINSTDFATPPEKIVNDKTNKSFDFSEYTLDSDSEEVHKKILAVVMEKKISYQEAAQIVFNS